MTLKIKKVTPFADYLLLVEFENGDLKQYDCTPLFSKFPVFKNLKHNQLFRQVQLDSGGYGISWNDEIDLAADELWNKGTDYQSPFADLISFSEATKLWNLSESTLRKSVSYGKLVEDVDCKKLGKLWVTTTQAMKKLYGEPKEPI